jgi:hypothetical protein
MTWTKEPDGWYATGHLGHQFLIQPWGDTRFRLWMNGWTPKHVKAISSTVDECKQLAEEEDAKLEPDKWYKEMNKAHAAYREKKK